MNQTSLTNTTPEIMMIHMIVAQRKEKYAGEYAPEVLDAIDEFGNDENAGEWLEEKLKDHRTDEAFEAVEIVTLEVSMKDIMARLRPNSLAATVLPFTPPPPVVP
jgi:hypothetical protein